MSPTPEVAAIEGVNLARVAAWLRSRGHGEEEPREVERLTGGTQNILVAFGWGPQRWVLRRPPIHKRASSDDTMRREARVLGALAGAAVAHPRLVDSCADDSVIGAAFYVMEAVNGLNPTTAPPQWALQVDKRRRFAFAVVEAAAAIAAVDHIAIGLNGLGRPDGFLRRQVDRWQDHHASYAAVSRYDMSEREVEITEVGRWLNARVPNGGIPGLMHGDFHLANVLADDAEPRVSAVIDWELATIGDPLLDLGWLLASWPGPGGPDAGTIGFEPWGGMPGPADLVEHYGRHSTRDLDDIDWYTVLACYKLGIVLEGTYVRALAGEADPDIGTRLHATSIGLFARAHEVMSGSPPAVAR